MTKLGPGTLTIGATGSEITVDCLINNARITASKNTTPATTKLCGTVRPGNTTYEYELGGNLDIDDTEGVAGLFALSQSAPGSEQDFEFVPNTEGGTTATGTLVIDPLDFGSTEGYGADLTSDFAWTLVGKPVYTYPPIVP